MTTTISLSLLRLFATAATTLVLLSCGGAPPAAEEEEGESEPAEIVIGERLFLEARFAQAFFAAAGGDVNATALGDPVLETTQTLQTPLPGPFRGMTMNCRACHLVDEHRTTPGGGVRTYADFARRSPVPSRDDGLTTTPRNSPPLVNATLPRAGAFFLHFDGEFATATDLVRGTYTGRNFGWLPAERDLAVAHIANVIRNDDGNGLLAADFGGLPYRTVLAGTDSSIPPALRLPVEFRLDVDRASDGEVLDAAAALVTAYLGSLVFGQDAAGEFVASPYDTFLRRNGLPRSPAQSEDPAAYSRRLRERVEALSNPAFITRRNGRLTLHDQEFAFGAQELEGLRVFLAQPQVIPPAADVLERGGVGNCVPCHPAPNFTDFRFHNTGAAQEEYDAVHGAGAFGVLPVPGLAERNAAPEEYLPPSAADPNAKGPFLAVPADGAPGRTDLGVWNVLGNPAVPAPQAGLEQVLCDTFAVPMAECTAAALLPRSIALFKTPGLRSLGQSAPYLHTGRMDTLEDVVRFYATLSSLARATAVRNADIELPGIALVERDVAPLVAFLRALNEDYE
jgi:hypothetical protein